MNGVYKNRAGVWCIYDYDATAYIDSVHLTVIDAAKKQSRQGHGHILFWPFEMKLDDAIKWWHDEGNDYKEG